MRRGFWVLLFLISMVGLFSEASALSCSSIPIRVSIYCSNGVCDHAFSVESKLAGEMCDRRTLVNDFDKRYLDPGILQNISAERFSGIIDLESGTGCLIHLGFQQSHQSCFSPQNVSAKRSGASLNEWNETRVAWKKIERKEWLSFFLTSWGQAGFLLSATCALLLFVPRKDRILFWIGRKALLILAFFYSLIWVSLSGSIGGAWRPWHYLPLATMILILAGPIARRILNRNLG